MKKLLFFSLFYCIGIHATLPLSQSNNAYPWLKWQRLIEIKKAQMEAILKSYKEKVKQDYLEHQGNMKAVCAAYNIRYSFLFQTPDRLAQAQAYHDPEYQRINNEVITITQEKYLPSLAQSPVHSHPGSLR